MLRAFGQMTAAAAVAAAEMAATMIETGAQLHEAIERAKTEAAASRRALTRGRDLDE